MLLTLLQVAGSVALLLWGVHMVQSGVLRAFGSRLRGLLNTALRNRLSAFLAGVSVTAMLQSSTATALMVAGFAAEGLVDMVPAIAVTLGANVGTTLVVDVLSFDLAAVTPVLVLVGLVMFRRMESGLHDFGRVLIGLGLMFTALRQLLDVVAPFEQVPNLHLLGAIATEPVLDVVLAAGLAWAAHSSIAVVLLVMSFADKGIIPPTAAYALVLGANLGTALNPVLEGAAAIDTAARRLTLGNLLNRLIGVALALAMLGPLVRLMAWVGVWIGPNPSRAVAALHTLFNAATAAAFLPVLPSYAALLRRLVPTPPDPTGSLQPLYTGPVAGETLVETLEDAAGEVLRLSDVLEAILQGFRLTLEQNDRTRVAEIKRLEDLLDDLYHSAARAYLTALDREGTLDADQQRATELLTFATNLKNVGVLITRNLLGHAIKRIKRGLDCSRHEQAELLGLVDRLFANLRATTSLFLTKDVHAARLLVAEKEAFRAIEMRAAVTLGERLLGGRIRRARTSSLHFDILRGLAQVNAHLVAAAAYPVLEAEGELLPSRLRQDTIGSEGVADLWGNGSSDRTLDN